MTNIANTVLYVITADSWDIIAESLVLYNEVNGTLRPNEPMPFALQGRLEYSGSGYQSSVYPHFWFSLVISNNQELDDNTYYIPYTLKKCQWDTLRGAFLTTPQSFNLDDVGKSIYVGPMCVCM